MPYIVAHFLFALLLVGIFKKWAGKKYFPKHWIIFVLVGAMLPDLDIILYIFLNKFGYAFYDIHKAFSHTVFIPSFFLLMSLSFIKIKKTASYAFVILAIAAFSHIVLDFVIADKLALFYPFSSAKFGLGIIKFLPASLHDLFFPLLDTFLFALCVIWLDLKLSKSKAF